MKRLACLIILLLIGTAAVAEKTYYTGSDDFYYHAYSNCGGVEGREPVAETTGYPCPVCIEAESDGVDICAVARGGTIVLRISDDYVYSQNTPDEYRFWFPNEYVAGGDDVWNMIAEFLHGERYAEFMRDYPDKGRAEAVCMFPKVRGAYNDGFNDLLMNERHLGAYWYFVYRPANDFSEGWDTEWYVEKCRLQSKADNSVYAIAEEESDEETIHLTPTAFNNAMPEYQRDGDVQIEIYRAMDCHIAVFTQKYTGAEDWENLIIDGHDTDAALKGYKNGENTVYCCVLTEGEMQRLVQGAAVKIAE